MPYLEGKNLTLKQWELEVIKLKDLLAIEYDHRLAMDILKISGGIEEIRKNPYKGLFLVSRSNIVHRIKDKSTTLCGKTLSNVHYYSSYEDLKDLKYKKYCSRCSFLHTGVKGLCFF